MNRKISFIGWIEVACQLKYKSQFGYFVVSVWCLSNAEQEHFCMKEIWGRFLISPPCLFFRYYRYKKNKRLLFIQSGGGRISFFGWTCHSPDQDRIMALLFQNTWLGWTMTLGINIWLHSSSLNAEVVFARDLIYFVCVYFLMTGLFCKSSPLAMITVSTGN